MKRKKLFDFVVVYFVPDPLSANSANMEECFTRKLNLFIVLDPEEGTKKGRDPCYLF